MNVVYYTDIKTYRWKSVERHLSKLSDADQRNILERKKEGDRLRTLLGRMLLLYALRAYEDKGCDALKEISFNKYGKPYISSMNGHFNISHSDTIVACGYSDEAIGIDVEKIAPFCLEDFMSVLTKEEYGLLGSDGSEKLYHVWTQKEALVKAVGKGLYYDPVYINLAKNLRDTCFTTYLAGREWNVYTYAQIPDYILTIASGRADAPLIMELPLEILI